MTITEAAHALGVSTDTVRRRLKAGELAGRPEQTMHGFRWLVSLTPMPNGAQPVAEASAQPSAAASVDGAQGAAEGYAAPMTERERSLWQQLAEKDRQIGELHVLLQRALEQRAPLVLPAAEVGTTVPAEPVAPRRRSWLARLIWGV